MKAAPWIGSGQHKALCGVDILYRHPVCSTACTVLLSICMHNTQHTQHTCTAYTTYTAHTTHTHKRGKRDCTRRQKYQQELLDTYTDCNLSLCSTSTSTADWPGNNHLGSSASEGRCQWRRVHLHWKLFQWFAKTQEVPTLNNSPVLMWKIPSLLTCTTLMPSTTMCYSCSTTRDPLPTPAPVGGGSAAREEAKNALLTSFIGSRTTEPSIHSCGIASLIMKSIKR